MALNLPPRRHERAHIDTSLSIVNIVLLLLFFFMIVGHDDFVPDIIVRLGEDQRLDDAEHIGRRDVRSGRPDVIAFVLHFEHAVFENACEILLEIQRGNRPRRLDAQLAALGQARHPVEHFRRGDAVAF